MCQLFFDEESIYEISKLYLDKFCNRRTHGRTDKPKAICPFNFSNIGGIKKINARLAERSIFFAMNLINSIIQEHER